LWTIGHGARTTENLLATLLDAGIEVVVDVRRFPGSRRHPHLAREALSEALPAGGVGYEWAGEALGGRRSVRADSPHVALRNDAFRGYADHMDTDPFRVALERLLADERRCAVMCAETLWWRCHRRLIADAAVLAGVTVVHLLDVGRADPHRLTEGVRARGDGRPIYDGGSSPLF